MVRFLFEEPAVPPVEEIIPKNWMRKNKGCVGKGKNRAAFDCTP